MLKVSFVILSFSNELFGVVSPFSAALSVPSGFSDRRFETAPDLSFSKHVKLVLANGNRFQIKALGLATNKAFKRDSQRAAISLCVGFSV